MPSLLDLFNAGRLKGYSAGAPSVGTAVADAEVCDHAVCQSCGHHGLRYQPYVNNECNSYVALAICPVCGEAVEF